MCGAVVANLMTPVHNFLHQVRILLHPDAYQKKSGLYLILIQDIQNLQGLAAAPGSVKADGDLAVIPLNAVYRQLPLVRQHRGSLLFKTPSVHKGKSRQAQAHPRLSRLRFHHQSGDLFPDPIPQALFLRPLLPLHPGFGL